MAGLAGLARVAGLAGVSGVVRVAGLDGVAGLFLLGWLRICKVGDGGC